MVIYLGQSPQHEKSTVLVLNCQTALVSPQFHITLDPSFQTCKQDKFKSKWQLKSGFITQRDQEPQKAVKVQIPQGSNTKEKNSKSKSGNRNSS